MSNDDWLSIHDSQLDAELVKQLGISQPLSTIDMTAPQLIGYDWLIRNKGGALSFDKGMGKTITYLSAGLAGNPEHGIIICPTNAMPAQRRELLRHFPEYGAKATFVRGTAYQRQKAWNSDAKVFITTQATLMADLGLRSKSDTKAIVPSWVKSSGGLDFLIKDECHKDLRNRKSKTVETLKLLKPQFRNYASGSFFNKGPQDAYPVLNLLDPKRWSSYWRLVNTYCQVEDSYWGKNIIGVKNVDQWRKATANDIIHRKKDLRDYPPKSRFFLDVEMEPWQKNLHDKLVNELMYLDETSDVAIVAQNAMEKIIRARIALICPRSLDPSFGWGAGLEAILEDFKNGELTHAVISTPFRICVPDIEKFLNQNGIHTQILWGGLAPDEQDNRITTWTEKGGIIIQTILNATSYELLAAQNMYFLGQDYSAENNKQAEDRLHRLSSTKPVNIWYARHLNTYEENIIERMLLNDRNVWSLMDKPIEVAKLLTGKA